MFTGTRRGGLMRRCRRVQPIRASSEARLQKRAFNSFNPGLIKNRKALRRRNRRPLKISGQTVPSHEDHIAAKSFFKYLPGPQAPELPDLFLGAERFARRHLDAADRDRLARLPHDQFSLSFGDGGFYEPDPDAFFYAVFGGLRGPA